MPSAMVKIAATGDVHGKRFLDLYIKAMRELPSDVEVFLLCGDVVDKGKVEDVKLVIEATRRFFKGRIYACFGNEEYETVQDKIVELSRGEIHWINESIVKLYMSDAVITLIGTRGCLDRPTRWQRRNIPRIEEIYARRVEKVKELLAQVKRGEACILFMHYAPTYKTLMGEERWAWPELGCRKMESVISSYKPTLVLHAHAHRGEVTRTMVGATPVYNVSLPARGKIMVIDISALRKATLDAYW